MDDTKEQLRLARSAADARRLRKHRDLHLDYDPSDMPSLSARRALARMYSTGRYTTYQVHDFTQSDNPAGVLRQLYIRRYVRATGTGGSKRWALTAEGIQRAEALRVAGFNDFLPPKPAPRLSPEDGYLAPSPPKYSHSPEPVRSRTARRQFLAGAPASAYLTPTQQRLLRAVADQPDGMVEKPNERTADALVRFALAERTPEGFQITEAGQRAAKELKS